MKNKHRDLDKICALCEHARHIHNEEFVLCNINGIVLPGGCCGYYSYDLLKRIPPKAITVKPLEYVDINDNSDKQVNP